MLQAQDFIGPIDLGSPACCQTNCTTDNFSNQQIWNAASAAGFDLSVYQGTAVAWPAMNRLWAGRGVLYCTGSYTCWS